MVALRIVLELEGAPPRACWDQRDGLLDPAQPRPAEAGEGGERRCRRLSSSVTSNGSGRSCAPRGPSPPQPCASASRRFGPAPDRAGRSTGRRAASCSGLAAAALLASLVAAGLTRAPHKPRAEGLSALPRAVRAHAWRQDVPRATCPRRNAPLRSTARRCVPAADPGAAPALPGDPPPAGQDRRLALDRDQARA